MNKKMNRKIRVLFVFTANQYNVLNEMIWKIADCLEKNFGYFVARHRLDDYQEVSLLEWDAVFSGQAIEFAECKEPDGRVHITWLVDHPRYLLPRMLHYSEMEHVYVGCVDFRHIDFLKRYYNIQNAFFLPHFGWRAKKKIPFKERKYDVFFPASNVRWMEDVARRYSGLEGALDKIANETIDFLLENTEYSLEEGMEMVLRQYGEKDVLGLSRECIEAVGEYIDFNIRIYARNKVMRGLLNAGITVTVCGRNWSEFPQTEWEREHLNILGEEVPYEEVIEIMADSKIVLNVMPWFKDGSHERIAMGTMNGAVCVTDRSVYVQKIWGEKGVVFYDWRKPEKLAECIKKLLAHTRHTEMIAQKGRLIAEKNASVMVCAEQIRRILED